MKTSAEADDPQFADLVRRVIRAGETLATFDFEDTSLPWREAKTPYRVFLAEFLLVRTRADVVMRLFEEIVAAYPDIQSLANTSEEHLQAVLQPLGMQKRVALLIRGARYILSHYDGQIPKNVEDLLTVPGLGRYTAAAIAAFAYDVPEVPADVNVLRFVSRLTGLPMEHPTKGSKRLVTLLPSLSKESTGLKPENLLDFTRKICRPRIPLCHQCSLRSDCNYGQSV